MSFLDDSVYVKQNAFENCGEFIKLAESHFAQHWRVAKSSVPRVGASIFLTSFCQDPVIKEWDQRFADAFRVGIDEYNANNKWCRIEKDYGFWLLRYTPGCYYDTHVDGPLFENNLRQLTGLIYLNSDFEGGAFKLPRQNITIQPEAGKLVLFPSSFTHPHEVEQVTSGTRYVLSAHFK